MGTSTIKPEDGEEVWDVEELEDGQGRGNKIWSVKNKSKN